MRENLRALTALRAYCPYDLRSALGGASGLLDLIVVEDQNRAMCSFITLFRSALEKGLNALDGALAAATPHICFDCVVGLNGPEPKADALRNS